MMDLFLPNIPEKLRYIVLPRNLEVTEGYFISIFLQPWMNVKDLPSPIKERLLYGCRKFRNTDTGDIIGLDDLLESGKLETREIENNRLTIIPESDTTYRIKQVPEEYIRFFISGSWLSRYWILEELVKTPHIGWTGLGNPLPLEYVMCISRYFSRGLSEGRNILCDGTGDRDEVQTPITQDLLFSDPISIIGRRVHKLMADRISSGDFVKGMKNMIPGNLYLIDKVSRDTDESALSIQIFLGKVKMIRGENRGSEEIKFVSVKNEDDTLSDTRSKWVYSYLWDVYGAEVDSYLFMNPPSKPADSTSLSDYISDLLKGSSCSLAGQKLDIPGILEGSTEGLLIYRVLTGVRGSLCYDLGPWFSDPVFPDPTDIYTEVLRHMVNSDCPGSSFSCIYREEFVKNLSEAEKRRSLLLMTFPLFLETEEPVTDEYLKVIRESFRGSQDELSTLTQYFKDYLDKSSNKDGKSVGLGNFDRARNILGDSKHPVLKTIYYLLKELYA